MAHKSHINFYLRLNQCININDPKPIFNILLQSSRLFTFHFFLYRLYLELRLYRSVIALVLKLSVLLVATISPQREQLSFLILSLMTQITLVHFSFSWPNHVSHIFPQTGFLSHPKHFPQP